MPGNAFVTGIAFAVQHHGRRDTGRALAVLNQPHVHLSRIRRCAQKRRRRVHVVLPAHVEFRTAHPVDHVRVEVQHLVELVGSRSPHLQHRTSSPIAVVLLRIRYQRIPRDPSTVARILQRRSGFRCPCVIRKIRSQRHALQGGIAFEQPVVVALDHRRPHRKMVATAHDRLLRAHFPQRLHHVRNDGLQHLLMRDVVVHVIP